MRSKKTRIVTESSTTSILILRNSAPGTTKRRCSDCSENVIWLRTRAAAELIGLTTANLYRMIETGTVHSETRDGQMQICARSLLKN